MRNLFAFLTRHNHWFVFLALEVISVILLFQYNSYQASVWFSSANEVAGKVYEANSWVETFFSLRQVNKELTQRNLELEQQMVAMQELLTRAKHDSTDVARTQKQALEGFKLYPARVVSNSLDKKDNFITIDKGWADGVKKDMGVACGSGVVGVVYLVSRNYSVVIPILNSHSNISCMIKGRGYFGYAHWNGGDPGIAYVDVVPRHARFKLGMNVDTSGYSSIFPLGVLVGKILHVFNSPNGLSYRLQVKLATDFGKLRDVCVIDNAGMEERLEMMRAVQDSLKVKRE